MNTASTEIVEFWNLFRQRAAGLAANGSTDSPAYHTLLDHLHRIDPGLYLEFCANPGACEMIVTADGDRSLFSLARAVVVAAPVNALLRALDHTLGEEKFAESVQYTRVLPLPENAAREQFISLSDLDAFIRWRQGRRQVG